MLGPTYQLTVDLAGFTGEDLPNVQVSVEMATPRLVYPLGAPTETLLPTKEHRVTDADGVALFDLLPSSQVGDYVVRVGSYDRTITMPARDVRLSELGTGGAGTPLTLRFGTSVDPVPDPAELAIVGVAGRGTIQPYAGERRHLVARLASEGDIGSVVYSDDVSGTNQIGAFAKHAGTVTVGGEDYAVWVSNQMLTQAAAVTLRVS